MQSIGTPFPNYLVGDAILVLRAEWAKLAHSYDSKMRLPELWVYAVRKFRRIGLTFLEDGKSVSRDFRQKLRETGNRNLKHQDGRSVVTLPERGLFKWLHEKRLRRATRLRPPYGVQDLPLRIEKSRLVPLRRAADVCLCRLLIFRAVGGPRP